MSSTSACAGGKYIEYRGFLSNHLSQYVTALTRLGASDEMIERAKRDYSAKLEARNGETANSQAAEEISPVETLLGKRRSFYPLVSHYRQLLGSLGGKSRILVRNHFPPLAAGLSCSALHPLLQIGYGLAANCDESVLEGLAYLHHSHVPLVLKHPESLALVGEGEEEVEEVLDRLRKDHRLREAIESHADEEEKVLALGLGRFQRRMLVTVTMFADTLLDFALAIAKPANLTNSSWLQQLALTLFTRSEVANDFFLLHGVTATWALTEQVIPCLEESDSSRILNSFLFVLLAVFVARECPALTRKPEPSESRDALRSQVLDLGTTTDEHIFKVVQVSLELSMKRNGGGWEDLCLQAATTALNHHLVI